MQSHSGECLTDEELLSLHSDGRIPPLVDSADPRSGLVNGHLLEIYQRGFSGVHTTPLGILLADAASLGDGDPWSTGDYHYNQLCRQDWTRFCRTVREFSPDGVAKQGDDACEACDRQHAAVAANLGRAMAYICCHGMIDFAVPVRVGEHPIAVLLTGQLRPKGDCDWPSGLVTVCTNDAACGVAARVDIRQVSRDRIVALTERYGIPADSLVDAMEQDRVGNRVTEIRPDDVRAMLNQLDHAASLLSNLATSTYELQRIRLFSIIRFEFALALANIVENSSNVEDGLNKITDTLTKFARLVDCTHVALCRLTVDDGLVSAIEVQSQVGLDGGCLGKQFAVPQVPRSLICGGDKAHLNSQFVELAMPQLSSMPFFSKFTMSDGGAAETGQKVWCAAPVCTPTFALFMRTRNAEVRQIPGETEVRSIVEVATTACLVCETLLLLKDITRSQQKLDRFIEDVAHDIRAPVHNIITKVALIKRLTAQSQQFTLQAARLGAAVMRIDLVARRIWTAQMLQRGALVYRKGVFTSLREVVAKAVDALFDLSHREQVEVVVESDGMEAVPPLEVDPEVFYEVILNLVHNAIKYSRRSTGRRISQVIVRGWREGGNAILTVGNRGLQIGDEERQRIFDRYYRTPQACRYRPDGAGIGLTVVKDFMDHYGGQVTVTSEPIVGTGDYLTIFVLSLRIRG
jgi:signal transduction histidine kinase